MTTRGNTRSDRPRRVLSALLALTASAATLALTGPAAAAPSDPSDPIALAPPISWGPCPKSEPPMPDPNPQTECATVRVPVDWSKPNGPKTGIFVARLRAADPSRRIGVLLSNPGGPGAPGADDALEAGMPGRSTYTPEMLQRFDVVGFDPRGTQHSQDARCDESIAGEHTARPRDAAAFERMRATNARLAASCLRLTGPLAAHMDTESVARDMDAIRAALGERRISYLGHSYGTLLGERYARLFPGRLRALALDSVVDPARPDAERFLTDSSTTVEAAFERLAAWCRTAAACPLKDRDLSGVAADLFARADAGTLRVPGPEGPTETAADADGLSAFLTFLAWQWDPERATRQLAAVHSGRGEVYWPDYQGPGRDMQLVLCRDHDLRIRDFAEYRAIRERVAKAAPHVRVSTQALDIVLGCQGWTVPPKAPPARVRGDLPPVLVANAALDLRTPVPGARRMAQSFPKATLLTPDVVGHWVYALDPGTKAAVDAYLTDPRG
ncbi:alpha/beta fold hydrolase [Kitasatospora sp. NBC_00458]|uniref:alpha/beta fold hydrolase n=1 Tax=Kitasatospora sp. NBC_00458 TaxID=2903568 RepID=UPI002E1870DC